MSTTAAAGAGPLVVISGASSGIGQALALQAWAQGCRLLLLARREAEMAHWVAAQGLDATRVRCMAVDVRDLAAVAAAGRHCLDELGVPDIVIANAGLSIGVDTADAADLEVMRMTWETHNLGTAALFQPFVAAMCARGSGRLVGVASVAGIRGLPGHGAYCASKAGVISYCESLRGECRPYGVKVVTLVPGYVDTPLTRGNPYGMPFLMPAEDFARIAWRAIEAGERYRVIPWQMGWIARLMQLLPDALFDRLLAGRPRKPRRPGA
ncbi:MAG: hypothetical protein RLY78_2171 [Pseudomonadota bacterium]|jgi:short-subunit dehydrogenase